MSIYYGMSGKESNLEQSYILLDLAGQVALRVRPQVWSSEFELTVVCSDWTSYVIFSRWLTIPCLWIVLHFQI